MIVKAFGLQDSSAILRQGVGDHFEPELVMHFESIAPGPLGSFADKDEGAHNELENIIKCCLQGELREFLDEVQQS